ncbi:hydroxymethylglutaryl-CoA synthase [Streptococcus sp. DD13]|uniref:hydroxymethylglutaryl-CoA synthase n=1 Tax=Streptococcus sp. DD13 TaxID=1777881 RepID=UPI0007999360|nr:hydroxymethylglutaryl-CoA synthase [Streptococcus sp. DD13]KXT78387.1 Hydroxymethylglutaryl-CoA synthase [Streptococcus sp. DD13]
MNIGIDKIGFATSNTYLDLADLAQARGVDPEKYTIGLLQHHMSVTRVTEDIVTLASRAAKDILTEEDKKAIDMVIVGTESGIDQSKASAVFVHHLLGIQPFARSIEIKEACYGATAALSLARAHIEQSPQSKVLVLASDIARYGLHSSGEPTQGAGAIAMLVSADPRILQLQTDNVCLTRDVMDFWRPNYAAFPEVDGRFSTVQYIDCLKTSFAEYQKRTGRTLSDIDAMVFHIPFSKQGLKGLQKIARKEKENLERLTDRFMEAIRYNQLVGNIYTGSLFLSLLSLLENSQELHAGNHILFYSYGSGAVCEIFSGQLVEGYEKHLSTTRLQELQNRRRLSIEEYETSFFEEIQLDATGTSPLLSQEPSDYELVQIIEHKRIYHHPLSDR